MRGYYRRVSEATDNAIAPTVTNISPTPPHNNTFDESSNPRRCASCFVSTADSTYTADRRRHREHDREHDQAP